MRRKNLPDMLVDVVVVNDDLGHFLAGSGLSDDIMLAAATCRAQPIFIGITPVRVGFKRAHTQLSDLGISL